MNSIKSINLVLRFLLELCALAGLGYAGAKIPHNQAAKITFAVSLPLLAACIWSLFVSPHATVDAGPALRLFMEIVVFGSAAAGVLLTTRVRPAVVLLTIYAANRVLMSTWDQ